MLLILLFLAIIACLFLYCQQNQEKVEELENYGYLGTFLIALISNTSITNEIKLALKNFDINVKQFKDMIIYGFKRSFFFKPYHEKRNYVRNIIDYYEKLEKKFLK